jgi:hypothetical protein
MKMKADDTSIETMTWQKYSYDELVGNPELQSEYDAMLASRPVWPSRIFVGSTTALILALLLFAVYSDM